MFSGRNPVPQTFFAPLFIGYGSFRPILFYLVSLRRLVVGISGCKFVVEIGYLPLTLITITSFLSLVIYYVFHRNASKRFVLFPNVYYVYGIGYLQLTCVHNEELIITDVRRQ